MKILLVNYRYFVSGGPEKYMFRIKKTLEDNGHEVIPFSVHSNRNVYTEYEHYFVEPIGGRDAIYYEDVKKTPKAVIQLLTRSIYSLEVKKAIQREIRDIKPDIVYIIHFVNKLSPSVIVGAKQMGIPVVVRLSDYFLLCPRFDFLYQKKVCEECLKRGYISCVKKRCVKNSYVASAIRVFSMMVHKVLRVYQKVDAFVTPSEYLKNKLVSNGFDEEKVFCIPTFTDGQASDKNQVIGNYGLYFGRIDVEKGVETVVKAYEILADHQLLIMGNDETIEGRRLKDYVQEKGLHNIEFIGFKSGEALDTVISKARFTLIPSIWYDNLPNTALESFRYSKPVIASDIGSLPELVINGVNGYLFAPGNVNALVDRIKQLDDDQTVMLMGEQSRKRLEQCFDQKSHYETLIRLFESVIS